MSNRAAPFPRSPVHRSSPFPGTWLVLRSYSEMTLSALSIFLEQNYHKHLPACSRLILLSGLAITVEPWELRSFLPTGVINFPIIHTSQHIYSVNLPCHPGPRSFTLPPPRLPLPLKNVPRIYFWLHREPPTQRYELVLAIEMQMDTKAKTPS